MARFVYDPENLRYDQVDKDLKSRVLRILAWVASSLILGLVIIVLYSLLFDTPRERELRQENRALSEDYKYLEEKYSHIDTVLEELQSIDQDIYRTIFETEPVEKTERDNASLEDFIKLVKQDNKTITYSTRDLLNELLASVELHEGEYLYLKRNASQKAELLKSIPAIQPIANPDLSRLASGYGNRMHPIYKIERFHEGIDFAAPTGTEIFATAEGIVKVLDRTRRGKGHTIIIDHENGYETIYSHLDDFKVRRGQRVSRGDLIGTVGNTGLSTAPHLHYEVRLNGEAVNPVNYFFLELSPEEYNRMIILSINSGQSFD